MEIDVPLQRVAAGHPDAIEELVDMVQSLSLIVPFVQEQLLAIPVSVKARVLKMAALCDLATTRKIIETNIFNPVLEVIPHEGEAWKAIDQIRLRIRRDLETNVTERIST